MENLRKRFLKVKMTFDTEELKVNIWKTKIISNSNKEKFDSFAECSKKLTTNSGLPTK